MNVLSRLKRKLKGWSKKAVVPVIVGGALVVGTASTASAAIDFSSVQTLITAAVADLVAGGLILLGAYAGFWGIKKVKQMFAGG